MTNILKLLSAVLLSASLAVSAAAASAGMVQVNGKLNVRAAATTSSDIRATLTKGTYVTLLADHGDWWFVEYADSRYGYVYGSYIAKIPSTAATVRTAGGRLNVRAGAGPYYAVIDSLNYGEDILILSENGGFSKILYDGNEIGYAAGAYLAPKTTTAGYVPITLSVPSYKQYDAAYASLRLPGSGEKVSTHGCAVTSLAMTESYRTGRTVTPKTVIETESFTDSGAIYWPSPYTRDETSLTYIYRRLASGAPVIVHGKKASGATHFAVVYGFTGGSLSAQNFLVRDPGSATRTTLAAFLTEYPTLIKTLSY